MPNLRFFTIFVKNFIFITDRVLHIAEFKDHFSSRGQFSISDILSFYQKFEERLRRSTLDWRIYELRNKGVLQKVGRGKYSLEKGQHYIPEADRSQKLLFNAIRKAYPFLNVCLWNTKWLNEFMLHQPGRFYTLVEVEKEGMEAVFYFLKDQNKDVFLAPSQTILNRYAINKTNLTVIVNLVTEAPTQTIDNITVPTIEKMMIDIFCDDVIFAAQQGNEIKTIFRNVFDKYTVDQSRMLRYAARRNKRRELEKFLKTIQVNGN